VSVVPPASASSSTARADRRARNDDVPGGIGGEIEGLPSSAAARALLTELERAGPSGEFLRRYFATLNALTVDDLRLLNHALQWHQWKPEGGVSAALFWGWRRHLETLQARRAQSDDT
jgi:hypothetical protein